MMDKLKAILKKYDNIICSPDTKTIIDGCKELIKDVERNVRFENEVEKLEEKVEELGAENRKLSVFVECVPCKCHWNFFGTKWIVCGKHKLLKELDKK